MIIDLIFLIAGAILFAVNIVFGLIPFDLFTNQLSNAIAWIFSPLKLLGGVLDLTFLASVLRNLILFEIAFFTYKLVLAIMNWIKLKGHHVK